MGIALPQVVTSDRASGAQVIDGSLYFDPDANNHLTKTSSAGNRRTFTLSYWIKESGKGTSPYNNPHILWSGTGTSTRGGFAHRGTGSDAGKLYLFNQESNSTNCQVWTNSLHRDFSAWKHIVLAVDTTQATSTNRVKIYINGTQETLNFATTPAQNLQLQINLAQEHRIGRGASDDYANCYLSQQYFIDGQQLDASYFGFTDGLTNTWRPKKNTNTTESLQPITTAPTLSNGALIIKAKGNSIGGLFESSSGNMNFHSSSDGISWTYISGGTSQVMTAAKYLAVGGAGTNNRTFTPNAPTGTPNEGYEYALWNTNTNFDVGSNPSNTDVTSLTYIDRPGLGVFGTNGFYLPMDGNSPIGEDKSEEGNNWTPVNFGGSAALDKATGAKPILNTLPGGKTSTPGVFGSKAGAQYTTTSATNSGGKYVFENEGTQPTFSFIRGATYTFDYNASTGHPLRFATAADAAGSTQYTDGTNTSVSNVISFTIPHNAPNTLYYYCTNHSGMGNSISVTTDETKADPYAWKCVLAYGNGTSDISNSINCTSTTKAVTNDGVAVVTTNSEFYGSSLQFESANTDSLTVENADFAMGTGDFTVEFWVYNKTNKNWNAFISTRETSNGTSAGWVIASDTAGDLYVHSAAAVAGNYSGDLILPLNRWCHVAYTRSGGTHRLFLNGVAAANSTTTSRDYTEDKLVVGDNGYAKDEPINAEVQDVRIYKGVAKYTSNFIPAATSPDILPDTPSGVSGSSKLAKVTDGAVIGDGTTSDYLQVSSSGHSDFSMDGDFTVEWYYYMPSITNTFMWTVGDSKTSTGLELYWGSNGTILKIYTNDGENTITGGPIVGWSHYAVVRSGSTVTAYYNGISGGTISNSTTFSGNFTIGGEYYNSGITGGLSGPSSNFRYIKGTALYTTDFTPPTRELTNVTNTKLLCCQSNTKPGRAAVSPNISGINNGTQWSSFLTTVGSNITNQPADAFSGNTWSFSNAANSGYSSDNTGNSISFNPPAGSLVGQVVVLYQRIRPSTVTINGTSATITTSGDTRICTVDLGSSQSITNVTTTATTDGQTNAFGYLEVDGVRVKDPVSPFGNAAATNFNPFNTDIKTVRGQESGYATLNPLDSGHSGGSITFSDGNLKAAFPSASGTGQAPATIYVSSGKWYCEYYLESVSDLTSVQYGIVSPGSKRASYIGKADTTDQYGWEPEIDRAYNNGNNTTPTGKTFTSQWSVAAMALDLDNGTWKMFIDGVPTGTIYSGISGTYTFAIGDTMSSGYHTHTANFGQKPFKFPPPDGFQPLNAANTKPVKVIARSDQYVGVTTWKGNGVTGLRTINADFKFKPDFVWEKVRTGTDSHILYDSVRGYGASKALKSNSTVAEGENDNSTYGYVNSVFNGGIEIFGGSSAASDSFTNENNQDMVAWSWKAGGSKNTFNKDDVGYASAAAAGLTAGANANLVTGSSVGTKQGFSIIKFNASAQSSAAVQLPHGLSQSPSFLIVKALDSNGTAWYTWHKDLSNTAQNRLFLNGDNAQDGNTSIWNNTAPSSTTFSVGGDPHNNDNCITYLWHDVPGLQKFGKYDGNNDANGPFIELGFRPTLFVMKQLTGTGYWMVYDSARDPINNGSPYYLFWNTNAAHGTGYDLDFLSNGVKLRTDNANFNASTPYVYMAWAEAPAFNLFGAQSNAR